MMVTGHVTSKTSKTSAILKLFPQDRGDCGNLQGRPGGRFIPRFFDLRQEVRVDKDSIRQPLAVSVNGVNSSSFLWQEITLFHGHKKQIHISQNNLGNTAIPHYIDGI